MLIGHPVGEVNRQLHVYHPPILPPSRPFFRNVHHSKIKHFEQAVVGRKNGFGFGDLAKLSVKPFNGIRGIYQSPDLFGIFEIRAEIRPFLSPGF